jgi:hypothetical protein
MRLELRRTTHSPSSTIGELWINGVFQCYTLEDVVRPDGMKIFGETAIPAGKYEVQLTMSPRFGRVLPLLLNVENFTGVRIHPGNSAKDTDGCILVGETKTTDWVSQSQLAFTALFSRLDNAVQHGEELSLTIT